MEYVFSSSFFKYRAILYKIKKESLKKSSVTISVTYAVKSDRHSEIFVQTIAKHDWIALSHCPPSAFSLS